MRTVKRHGEEYTVLEGGILCPTFDVKVRGASWFGGFLEINADDQTKMQFLVPIGQWKPIFGRLPVGYGCVPCGDPEQFRQLLTVLTIATGTKEVVVYEHVSRKDSAGNWLPNTEDHELFRIMHDWEWHDKLA